MNIHCIWDVVIIVPEGYNNIFFQSVQIIQRNVFGCYRNRVLCSAPLFLSILGKKRRKHSNLVPSVSHHTTPWGKQNKTAPSPVDQGLDPSLL